MNFLGDVSSDDLFEEDEPLSFEVELGELAGLLLFGVEEEEFIELADIESITSSEEASS